MIRILNVMMIAAGALFVFVLVIVLTASPRKPVSERIAEECRRLYGGGGQEAVNRCQIEMGIRYLKDVDREKRDAAYNRIR